tara:strand:- start:93 stop:659 length:567 start_codon:yes stop_codon:yes gene_type:complete
MFAERFIYTVDPKLPKPILEEIFKQCKNLEFVKSIDYADSELKKGQDVRKSKQHWLPWDTWIAGIMHNIFISANNDYFHYDLNHFDSGIQITRYGLGDYYDWHIDMVPFASNNIKNYSRKLSMSFLLNDDFEGGELEVVSPMRNELFTVELKAGTVAIFPAWIKHRVKPVTSGKRYSLVAWMNGPEFK